MIRHLINLVAFALLFWSCQKIDLNSDYPTKISKLPAEILSQKRQTFSSANSYLITSLNEFGFCGFADEILSVDSPPVLEPLTESEAIEKTKIFVTNNPSTTGVRVPDDLTFYQISYNSGYADGGTSWNLKSAFQKVDSIEVMYSEIIFMIKNREVEYCIGNWYPNVYVPKSFNFNQEKSKAILVNKVVSHTNIGGQQYNVTISSEDLNSSITKLKILPITTDNKIELRVTWQINIPGPVFYKIYVDVMTGDIIGEEPTIIS